MSFSLISDFQSPSQPTASKAVVALSALSFPNPNAQRDDFAPFDLTEAQWNFIKGNSSIKLKHGVLVKRTTQEGSEAVILDIDLSGLGSYLKLYESGSQAVNLVKDLQARFGETWIPHYVGEKV